MILPEAFVKRMKLLLEEEYEAFETALLGNRSYGLRINPLKVDLNRQDEILKSCGIIGKVPWADEGYYYSEDARPGKTPYHEGGAFYIQEPSAMSVVQALDPKPGDKICDLCAAPGGKTTHIAGRMGGSGLLVSNEIVLDRARILAKNVERMGISNCMVVNHTPDEMAIHFPGFFDKIVVDAPCSGEGMFRKEDAAISEWSLENVELCVKRQMEILNQASIIVRPGGTMVYSTCTFEPSENEGMIDWFLETHPDWNIVDTGLSDILTEGKPEWITRLFSSRNCNEDCRMTNRILPHTNKGEGHFLAKLVKQGGDISSQPLQSRLGNSKADSKTNSKSNSKKGNGNSIKDIMSVVDFLNTNILSETSKISDDDMGRITIVNNEHVYLRPEYINEYMCKGLRIIRGGLEIAEINRNRFEPAHALAMALTPANAKFLCETDYDDACRFLRGETINRNLDIPNGSWVLVTIEGISLGWGKFVNGIIKNHYPKGLRIKF